jgi:hypothetical protein
VVPWALCPECGAWLVGRRGRRFCSAVCRRRAYEQANSRKGYQRSVCIECGIEFETPYGDKRRDFCSLRCARRFGKFNRKFWKKANGDGERIQRWAVVERDRHRCGICGTRVDPLLEYPDPMSASIDHIVPLSRGGTHTYDNVQLAHLKCNRDKSDAGVGQLRLGIYQTALGG